MTVRFRYEACRDAGGYKNRNASSFRKQLSAKDFVRISGGRALWTCLRVDAALSGHEKAKDAFWIA